MQRPRKKKELKQRLGKKVLRKAERSTKSPVDLGGGVVGCRGFHSSFRTTQGGNNAKEHIRRYVKFENILQNVN